VASTGGTLSIAHRVCRCSASPIVVLLLCRVPVVVAEYPTEPFSAGNGAFERTDLVLRINQLIPKALMIPFVMVVNKELVDRPSQRALAKEDHAVQTALFYGPNPSFGISVQVGRPWRKTHGFTPAFLSNSRNASVWSGSRSKMG